MFQRKEFSKATVLRSSVHLVSICAAFCSCQIRSFNAEKTQSASIQEAEVRAESVCQQGESYTPFSFQGSLPPVMPAPRPSHLEQTPYEWEEVGRNYKLRIDACFDASFTTGTARQAVLWDVKAGKGRTFKITAASDRSAFEPLFWNRPADLFVALHDPATDDYLLIERNGAFAFGVTRKTGDNRYQLLPGQKLILSLGFVSGDSITSGCQWNETASQVKFKIGTATFSAGQCWAVGGEGTKNYRFIAMAIEDSNQALSTPQQKVTLTEDELKKIVLVVTHHNQRDKFEVNLAHASYSAEHIPVPPSDSHAGNDHYARGVLGIRYTTRYGQGDVKTWEELNDRRFFFEK